MQKNALLISYALTLLWARHSDRLPASPCLGAGDRINISQQVTTSHDGSRQHQQGQGREMPGLTNICKYFNLYVLRTRGSSTGILGPNIFCNQIFFVVKSYQNCIMHCRDK